MELEYVLKNLINVLRLKETPNITSEKTLDGFILYSNNKVVYAVEGNFLWEEDNMFNRGEFDMTYYELGLMYKSEVKNWKEIDYKRNLATDIWLRDKLFNKEIL